MIGVATGCHDGGTDLTEAHPVSPASAVKTKSGPLRRRIHLSTGGIQIAHLKGRTLQMGFRQDPSYLKLLSDYQSALGASDLQAYDAAGLSPFQRLHRLHIADLDSTSAFYQLRKFRPVVFLPPAVEINGLLIVIVKDLPEDLLVLSVTETVCGGIIS